MVLSSFSAPTPLAPSTFTHAPSEGGDYVERRAGNGRERRLRKRIGERGMNERTLLKELLLVQAYGKQLQASGSNPLLLGCRMLHPC